jgi:hypothetical protein
MDADARERRGRSRTRRSIETTAAAAANEEEVDIEFDRTIALGSSGWLFIYYVGVIKVLRRNGYAAYVLLFHERVYFSCSVQYCVLVRVL